MKKLMALFIIFIMSISALYGCSEEVQLSNASPESAGLVGISSKESSNEENNPTIIELDVATDGYDALFDNLEAQPQKPYTILMYINGTDLETNSAMASGDIREMIDAKFSNEEINLIILTGGTNTWHNNVIPSDATTIHYVSSNGLVQLANLGEVSMADKDLLAAFIDYGVVGFPADKYGFIFWNHGGGPMGGYGSDEKFNNANLSIVDIEEAFYSSLMPENKFEFIGFDCCLMGTIELAYLLKPFANYFIASEDTEPGYGWNYNFLTDLSNDSSMTGDKLGKIIVDKFIDFYENIGMNQPTTLSVVDLNEIENLTDIFEDFMQHSYKAIQEGDFATISKARQGAKAYGNSGTVSQYDLIDIKHLALRLQSAYPDKTSELIDAIDSTVVYNRFGSKVENSYGLSTYIPYDQKQYAKYFVNKYKSFEIMPNFVNFLSEFTNQLTSEPVARSINLLKPELLENNDVSIKLDPETLNEINNITFTIWKQLEEDSDYFIKLGLDNNVEILEDGTITTAFDGYWATLNGQTACFYELESFENMSKYSTPALLNGQDVDIILLFDEENPDGLIIGAIPPGPEDSFLSSKQMISIEPGDTVQLKYFSQLFLENEEDADLYEDTEMWIVGEEFTVEQDLKLEIVPVDDELYLYGFWIEDIYNNNYYTDFIEIRY